ncbi:TPA: hypothetical protein ACRMUA_001601 [Pseudomonas aeruginosa]|uniref:hypothetical protein n=1 Tax=Pseudomonas aeruginosa TaxID=287 RepID=UPI00071BCC36|nr:hypothetical protein [Pseudomonas aeruginosa]KSC12385.1 hypothetical protein AO886_26635 [Pseudomonas aeruginosa]MBG5429526.1 hypothetical protein [Pseudomonas aeruginosa]MCS7779198.1 hypothetical protein [Pseudomonas aeruginosa]HBO5747253.1 hypothetical protein [Pseudomonas aeruginosa]HBO5785553.1 hypothetical protein [Pseudomonas aeruginosa]
MKLTQTDMKAWITSRIWIWRAARYLRRYVDWGWIEAVEHAKKLQEAFGDWHPEDAVLEDMSYWY